MNEPWASMDLQPIYISARANPHPNSCAHTCACVCDGNVSLCMQIVCVCPHRCEVSAGQESGVPPSAAHARLFSCLYRGRQQRSRGELEAVVTLCALGFGVLTLSVFFFFLFLINGYAVGGERLLEREHPVLLWPLRQTVCSLFRA